MSRTTRTRVRKALADQHLQTAMARLMPLLKLGRQLGMTGIDFKALQQELHQVKEKAIANMPQLIAQFKENAAKAGATVFDARDAKTANEYVLQVARTHRVEHIVKSKSMLGEEIGIREYLEHAGIETTETDIGEWIVQLAKETPAHISGPAIHKTIEQVAELFAKATGKQLSTDPQLLLDTARETLRQYYINAQMGISGANAAIAETGTLVIVTNEGNGVMSTTLPPIHVALVGYEKLLSSLEGVNALLRLLSRSTVGSKMPVYVSYITGPSAAATSLRTTSFSTQGPRELHIVLVDNGRSQMWKSAEFREALYCVRCGACLNVCPVFASLAGQTYGHIYQGGIGTVLTAFHHGWDKAQGPVSLCMGCIACKDVCPAGIDIPRLVLNLKIKLAEEMGLPWTDKLAFQSILKHPGRLNKTVKLASGLQRPFVDRDLMIRHLPYPFNALAKTISLPALSSQPLYQRMKHAAPRKTGKPRVAFYAGCVANYAYPELSEAAIKALKQYNTDTYYPIEQVCCGAPAFFSGDIETAMSLAKKNIEALEKTKPDYIVTVCPGCANMLQNEYPSLTLNEHNWNKKAKILATKIRDFSQLILELFPMVEKKPERNVKVTYHDPCHLKRGRGICNEPRQLLQREGFELVEMNDSDACCGFGGHVVLAYPELSGSVLNRKLDNIEATGAQIVVTNCAACLLQLRGGLDKRHSRIKAMHPAELLAR
ncbi:MAG: 4Fe-4S dicluster domain-containing protein [Chloroflexi bacterium]|nr:4Fe-4S dicluster domain-containing protein [Chloroflexota bacterium]MBM3172339.1 4Fe-4S dicluster domain-containing protein [Chloroflexota bacterium]MBM3175050.1 4Fe-4S dicluster domain-containing protein [Chloroflexota bacterium]MBM4449921.1 4Fe-4S dicluster domain-containing protein [Chloroflexota bacterium]